MTKIAIVIGHNERSQGAVRVTDGQSEFRWNSDLAALIADHAPHLIKVFERTHGGGYPAEIDRVYARTDAWGADCTIELHFNASGNANVKGCETLTSGTKGSLALAHAVNARMVVAMEGPDRGVKRVSRKDRGGRSVWQGKAPAILVEPYFGSNRDECVIADRDKDELAEAIYRGAMEVLGRKVGPAAPAPAIADPSAASMAAVLGEIHKMTKPWSKDHV